uniref:Protein kinase domain-containing protein n=1 Tax=Heterorhabditis bacteriophora TaxID=37862 RepID=A0A1I7XL05_HETBA
MNIFESAILVSSYESITKEHFRYAPIMTSSSEGEILQVSQVIRERWKIKQKIGGGGFGEIYEATDIQNHNERVAIKVKLLYVY